MNGPQLPKENPSAYIVQDRDNQQEMTRLDIQDKMLTFGQGGPLPELADPTSLRRVLDVGCGTGDWLMETARTYPTIEQLVGGDISSKMLAYARAKAVTEQLDHRVQFKAMDAFGVSWNFPHPPLTSSINQTPVCTCPVKRHQRTV